ncbi:MAG TPA: transporter [Flavobacteriaceae bacterium]|nr:transporter [Flavobacteriaceae bacterium]
MKQIFLLPLFWLCLAAKAQETEENYGAIITDRPDQTESPNLVSTGFLQIETGFAFEEASTSNFNEKTTTYNATLLRYGLLDNLELRLGFDFSETETKLKNGLGTNLSSGMSPLYAGFKIGVTEEKGMLPKIGFLGGVLLPFTAADAFRPTYTGGEFRFAFAHTLSDKWSLSYNTGVSWNGTTPNASYLYSLVWGYAFTEKLSAFAEVYGSFPEDEKAQHLADAGLTYLISNNFQLDLAAGTGISTDQDFFVGIGASLRLPK